MRLLYHMSIKRKQMLIIMLISTVALLLASAIFVGDDVINFRTQIVKNVSALAQAIGNNCSATIEYNDPNTAEDTLRAFHAEPSIVAACLYTSKGELFASYYRPGLTSVALPSRPAVGYQFKGDYLYLFRPITQRGETIGTIFVMSDLSNLQARLNRYPAVLGGMLAAAMLVAFILSTWLQRIISDPVLHLAQVARSVAAEKNYSIRAIKRSGDELGQLIGGFNEMLAQIQARDAALLAARESLENRVQARTEELRQSQALYHSLVEHLPMFVYRKDETGRFVFVNAQFCQFYGKTTDQILGKTVLDITGDKDSADQQDAEDKKITVTGEPIETEGTYRDPAGNVKYLQIFKSPVFNSDGKVTGIQGMLLDVTERRLIAEKLEETYRELVAASRQAGMAEVATNVLHNVGNVLNSVNVSATVISDAMKTSEAANLGRVVALIQEHPNDLGEFITNDPRGKRISGFLAALSKHIAVEQSTILKEAEALKQHIEHIKDIVMMQQSYAKVVGLIEAVDIVELVEYALRLNLVSLERHQVRVVRDFEPGLPQIPVEKNKVLQILVNLIRNAKQACDDSGKAEKIVSIALKNGADCLKISVSDNGVGIPSENLTRIFSHGFTTRRGGHGFGLHSGALAAKEMNGTLVVHSDGVGKGATFTLALPLQPKK